jgi:ATP-binding cassette subfamily B protein
MHDRSPPFHPPESVERPHYLQGPQAFLWRYLRERSLHFAGLLLLVVAAASCAISVQYVTKMLVDAMAGPQDTAAVSTVLALYLGLIAGESLLWRLTGWLGCRTTVGVGVDVRLDLFDYLNGQPLRYFADNLAGALGQRITSTAGYMGALINTAVWRVLPPCIDFLGALVVFATVNLGMVAALASFVILMTGSLIAFGGKGRPRHQHYAERANLVGGDLVDVISNMWAVKAFSARGSERRRLAAGFCQEAEAQRASWMYTERARLLHDVALWAMAGTMLTWSIALWRQGAVTPGDVVLVSILTFRILHGSRELALSLVDMAQQLGFIADTLHVIGQQQDVVDAPRARPLAARGGAIEFRRVDFSYGGRRPAISDLSITIPPGQKLGIVGPSGAGKSTFIQLLQRLYDVERGSILLDGQPIHEVTQDSLRAGLAVVPQEINLFHRSIMENIRFARPDASDDEVIEAARAALCDNFVRALPQGYDTLVGERGIKLSGGQRQRIGIARAFLKQAEIIVLDEATSALDTQSEMEIQRAFVRLTRGRTVIAVAHRLSTLSSFDRVVVIQGGRIVEDGAPGELRKQSGPFARMWQLQAEGLALEEVT